MHDPRSSIVGFESYSNKIIGAGARVDYVAADRVVVVVNSASRTPDDGECMAMKMNRVLKLYREYNVQFEPNSNNTESLQVRRASRREW